MWAIENTKYVSEFLQDLPSQCQQRPVISFLLSLNHCCSGVSHSPRSFFSSASCFSFLALFLAIGFLFFGSFGLLAASLRFLISCIPIFYDCEFIYKFKIINKNAIMHFVH